MALRVLHIVTSLDWGGTQRQLSLLAPLLRRGGLDVHVCSLKAGGATAESLAAAGVPVRGVSRHWPKDLMACRRLQHYIRDLQPEVVQTWLPAANSWGKAVAIQTGVRHVISSLTLPHDDRTLAQRLADRWLNGKTSAFVATAPHVQQAWIARGLPAEKVELISPGVADAESPAMSRAEFLASLGLPADALLVGAAGPLVQRKRLKELVWAADQINVLRGGHVHLLIFGDGPERRLVERYRRLFHIAGNVHLLGWRTDFLQLLPHLNLFWSASAAEGLPMSLLEAMAAGVPVVATDIPAHRQLITHAQNGYLTDPKIRSDFTRYSDWILADPAKASSMRDEARRRSQQYSVAATAEDYLQLYRRIAG